MKQWKFNLQNDLHEVNRMTSDELSWGQIDNPNCQDVQLEGLNKSLPVAAIAPVYY